MNMVNLLNINSINIFTVSVLTLAFSRQSFALITYEMFGCLCFTGVYDRLSVHLEQNDETMNSYTAELKSSAG